MRGRTTTVLWKDHAISRHGSSRSSPVPLHTLLAGLRNAFNPQRPVEIIAVSAGKGADKPAVGQVTSITSGASFVVQQRGDIDKVFFDSVGRRICQPNCG